MNQLIAMLITAAFTTAATAGAVSYSTEATVSHQKEEGTYRVEVRVSQLEEREGKMTEQLLTAPKILSSPGVPSSVYHGLSPDHADYAKQENVTVDVTWPYPNESGVATCSVTIKRGDTIVSKSKMNLQIDGPGRNPFVVGVQEIDPATVQVIQDKGANYLFLHFKGKTKEEVKKLAVENYGNKVHVRDSKGRLVEGGLSLGTYKETGMTVEYKTKAEAEQVAALLRGSGR